MRKRDLATDVMAATGLPLAESLHLVERVLQLIVASLRRGEPVRIVGFGQFHVRQKQARRGRNPRTGETLVLTPRRVVQFRASPVLKHAVAAAGLMATTAPPAARRGRRALRSPP